MSGILDNLEARFYEFGRFRLVPEERILLRDGRSVAVPPKVFDALVVLVEQAGHLVEKNELLDRVWADTFVEEGTLARNISILRKALGENGQKYIETVPKRGYRFIEPVTLSNREIKREQRTLNDSQENFDEPEDLVPQGTRRPVLLLTLAFVFVAGILSSLSFWNAGRANPPKVKSIAVLPFKSIGEGERNESLELGLADAVVTRLGKVRQTVVRPTSMVFKYFGTDVDPAQVANELQAEAVLEGTIQKHGERTRVTTRLINISDGSTLWAGTFDANSPDVFSAQDSISAQIAQGLNLVFSNNGKPLNFRQETENMEAYRLYREGRFYWNKRTPEGLLKAIGQFEKAKELDPNYAPAYAGVADCYVLLGEYRGMPANEAFAKARIAASKALEIDNELAEAHTAQAYILGFYDWDWAGAEKEYKRAIELNPNYPNAHFWYAEFLQVLGRFDESLAEYRRAEELDPLSLITKAGIAGHFYLTRQYDISIEQSQKIIEMDPTFVWGYGFLWLSYKEKGMLPEAVDAHIKAQTLSGMTAEEIAEERKAYARSGWKGFWQKILELYNAPNRRKRFQAIDFVAIYAGIDDKKNGIKFLRQAYQARERWLLNIKYAPQFDSLRDDPTFTEILNRIGLN